MRNLGGAYRPRLGVELNIAHLESSLGYSRHVGLKAERLLDNVPKMM